jgi:Outer membrane receptor for ferric coprogen and ferric-rhodotorulic acid
LYDETFQEQVGLLLDGGTADPSYGRNKEIGLKKTWFQNKLMTNLTVYHLTKTNMLTAEAGDIRTMDGVQSIRRDLG